MAQSKPPRTIRTYISWVLFAVSAALFISVAVMYVRDDGKKGEVGPPPSSTPGHNEAIHVKQALEAKGVKVAFAPSGGRSDELSVAGQLFDVDGADLYVFIYPQGPDQRIEEVTDVDLSTMQILNTRGTPEPGGPPLVVMGSNVIGVLYGGSDDLQADVKAAIEGLP